MRLDSQLNQFGKAQQRSTDVFDLSRLRVAGGVAFPGGLDMGDDLGQTGHARLKVAL